MQRENNMWAATTRHHWVPTEERRRATNRARRWLSARAGQVVGLLPPYPRTQHTPLLLLRRAALVVAAAQLGRLLGRQLERARPPGVAAAAHVA